MKHPKQWLATVALAAVAVGCDPGPQTAPRSADGRGVAPRSGGFERGTVRDTGRERQAEFLNRIRESDPQHQTIQKAVLNERNELGLILSRSVDMNSVPSLMRAMLTQMAREFPGQDLTVIAYAPTDPPMKIGTGRLDARTRQMNYTPAR